jgi:PASTA domain
MGDEVVQWCGFAPGGSEHPLRSTMGTPIEQGGPGHGHMIELNVTPQPLLSFVVATVPMHRSEGYAVWKHGGYLLADTYSAAGTIDNMYAWPIVVSAIGKLQCPAARGAPFGPVTVPSVVGKTVATAEAALHNANLVSSIPPISNSQIPLVAVGTQNPQAGTSVSAGSAVRLTPAAESKRIVPLVGIAWSNAVLAAAALPPGAKATTVAVPTLRAPGQYLSTHQVDVHRLYLVPGTRATVASYILRHLPRGGSANQGNMIQTDPVSYDAEFIPVTMPAAGANEDVATLLYAFAADGPGIQELRIDAQTVSTPNRTAASKAAPTGRVVVTGYGVSSLAFGSSHPVTVTLTGVRAEHLRAIFDRLGLGQAGGCMEYSEFFSLRFFDHGSRVLTATDGSCGTLSVSIGRTGVGLSDPHCALLGVVVSNLPAGSGAATRSALQGCRMVYVG